jgi:NADPH-dependent 2,4-dienoyl-CoA reductase/sulfur reductase-like enzyme
VARRAVTLDNAQEVSFDRLLIATGAHPRHLHLHGAELPNLFYLRTVEDAERLQHAIEQARPAKRGAVSVAIIGGGVLGVEMAASLRQMGLEVDLIVAGQHPWEKFAGETTGKVLTRLHGEQRRPRARRFARGETRRRWPRAARGVVGWILDRM